MGILDAPSVTPSKAREVARTSPQARGTASPAERGDMVFTRYNNGAVIFSLATQTARPDAITPTTSTTIYWLWLVNARKYLGASAKDEYYLYWSTDHDDTANAGIYMATGPTPAGPWSNYGRVWNDTRSGVSSTETMSVVWDDDTGVFLGYYQVKGAPGSVGTQTTCYATSPNGINWTYGGIAVDIPSGNTYPGDGHTGYFRPFKIGGRWFAYHLMGGQNFSRTGISQSHDGRTWLKDPRPLLQAVDQLPTDLRWGWNGTNVVQWRGEYWGIGTIANLGSGGGSRIMRIVAARLTSDMRHFTGAPKVLLYPFQSPETENVKSVFPFVDDTGRLWLLYQTDENVFAAYID